MSAPKFRYDFALITRSLASGQIAGRAWLEESWGDPDGFHRALFAEAKAGLGLLKSRPYESYDFYHDLVSQHLGKKLDALVYRDRDGALRKLSYDALDATVTRLCRSWQAQGVAAGESIAIVQPIGGFYAAALLAALRLGLAVSCIEPRGKTYVHNRLALLAPARVVADAQHAWYVEGHAVLDNELSIATASAPFDAGSHSYAAADVVLRCASALGQGEDSLVELTADDAYLPLLRDSVLVLPIRQGEHVAGPGLAAEQYQPWFLLATWLAGGCFVELSLDDVTSDPLLLDRAELHVLGVGHALRRLLERLPADAPRLATLRRWFRNPLEPLEWNAWLAFAARFKERGVGGCNLVVNAAHGGVYLFSPKSFVPDALRVLPVPGLSWELVDLNLAGTPALFESGILRSASADGLEAATGRLLLGRADDAYALSGSVDPLCDARCYPTDEVARLIETVPGVEHCVVVLVRDPRTANATRSIALLFANPTDPAQVRERGPRLVEQAKDLVRRELGADRVPEQLDVYPLFPLLQDGRASQAWCNAQFGDGMLAAKAARPVFSTLGALRRLFAQPIERS